MNRILFPQENSQNVLDTNTSCVIIANKEPRTLPTSFAYEIEYKGRTIRCRTAADAERLLERLEGGRLAKDSTAWTNDEFIQFTGRIHLQQRRLLAKLLDYGTTAWLEDVKLRDDLDIPDNKSLAGTLSGISKVALKFDINPRRIYSQKTVYQHAKPRRLYQVTSAFLQAAAKHKWPSKDALLEPK